MEYEKQVTKTLQFRIDQITDIHSVVRVRWKSSEGFSYAIVKTDDFDPDCITSPEEVRKYDNKLDDRKRPYISIPEIENDPYRNKNIPENFLPSSFGEDIPKECWVIFYDGYNNTVYDEQGNLTNWWYADSVIGENYKLREIIDFAETVDWMEVNDNRYGGGKIYYVPGNGDSISIEFNLTPDEYQEAIVDAKTFRRFESILKVKGIDVEKFKQPERDYDDEDDDF